MDHSWVNPLSIRKFVMTGLPKRIQRSYLGVADLRYGYKFSQVAKKGPGMKTLARRDFDPPLQCAMWLYSGGGGSARSNKDERISDGKHLLLACRGISPYSFAYLRDPCLFDKE